MSDETTSPTSGRGSEARPEIASREEVERRMEAMRLEELDIDALAEKIGGYFQATSLLQKRLRELIRYVPEATRMDNKQLISLAIEEIEQEVIGFRAPEREGDGAAASS